MSKKHRSTFYPIIMDETRLNLIGCVFYGNPFHSAKEWSYENEIGKLWQRFIDLRYRKYKTFFDKIQINPKVSYEIHIEPEEFKKTKNYYVFIGVEVEYFDNLPLELFHKSFPITKYVTFPTKGNSSKDAEYVFYEWLGSKDSGYEQNYPYVIQKYHSEKYKGLDNPESVIDWMIPIKMITIDSKSMEEE